MAKDYDPVQIQSKHYVTYKKEKKIILTQIPIKFSLVREIEIML